MLLAVMPNQNYRKTKTKINIDTGDIYFFQYKGKRFLSQTEKQKVNAINFFYLLSALRYVLS